MNKLTRYYNQNRKKIWAIIIIIAFAFAMLRLANYFAKINNQKAIQNVTPSQVSVNNNLTNTTAVGNSVQSSSSGKFKTQIAETDIIKEFTSYCNKKELENAYNMLTNECKNQMFSGLQSFEDIYYNSAFENKTKEVIIENWSNHTYLVYFRESALATGKATDTNQKGDYITVVKDDEDNYKLNVNSYIGYKEINKTKEENGIKMEVVCKNIYMNYEEYKIIVTNQSEEEIILDRLNDGKNVYLEDDNRLQYPFYSHEFSENLFTISQRHTREYNIKFYNSYNSSRKINSLIFSNVWKGKDITKYKIDF